MGEIRVLTSKGDERIEWDPADAESVATAKKEFDRLTASASGRFGV